MLQAVFFDFDGVIADSEPLHLQAYQSVLRLDGINLSSEDYYERYLGYDDVGLFHTLMKDRGLAIDAAKIDRLINAKSKIIESLLSADDVLFPGAVDCVKMCAAHVPLAVASGALGPEIELVLRHAGLRDSFKAIASASDGVRGKPAPDLYLLAIAKLREFCSGAVDAGSSVAIEDSHWGLEAARAAGLRCVAVTHTYRAGELSGADLVVESLGDITIPQLEQIVRDNRRTS
jgi:beta-phosphoglucomutase-like phosphatase (HAD superfamily)